MTIAMIISISVLVILQISILVLLHIALSYMKELIVKFVDINQEFYTTQKHINKNASDNLQKIQKSLTSVTSLKRVANRLSEYVTKLNASNN